MSRTGKLRRYCTRLRQLEATLSWLGALQFGGANVVNFMIEPDPVPRGPKGNASDPVVAQDLPGHVSAQAAYARTGVAYELHVLEGCGHAAWCYDGKGACRCKGGTAGYGDTMDALALPFVAKQLGIKLL